MTEPIPTDLKEWYESEKEKLLSGCPPNRFGLSLSQELTQLTTHLIRRILSEVEIPDRTAMCATGSLARCEMSPHSDVDVVFLTHDIRRQESIETLVQRLWDVGLRVGHSVRTFEGYIQLASTDIEVLTSLFDLSPISDTTRQVDIFRTEWIDPFLRRAGLDRARALVQEWEHRQTRSVSFRLLEPDVKESGGGLRDLHGLACLASLQNYQPSCVTVVERLQHASDVSPALLRELTAAFEFFVLVRNAQHFLAGRKQDTLTYDLQNRIAQFLRYPDVPRRAVETFMQEFFVKSRFVFTRTAQLRGLWIRARIPSISSPALPVEPPFSIRNENDRHVLEYDGDVVRDFTLEPSLVMKTFLLTAKFHASPSEPLQSGIQDVVSAMDAEAWHPVAWAVHFRTLWKYEGQIAHALRWMHDLDILSKYLPEFGYIVAHHSYNVYHAYTTDEHLIVTVEMIERLFQHDPPTDSLRRLKDLYDDLSLFEKTQLYLAAFLHDVGKSRGGDHCEIGVDLARQIFARTGLDDVAEVVTTLIRHHLRMEQIAFRRNLSDPDVISGFANLLGDRRRLRQLYLLTYADICASNPKAWTEWKATLLQELFDRSDAYLMKSDPEAQPERECDKIALSETVRVSFEPLDHYSQVTVVTRDRPYCLARICGAFAACDIGIFDATIHTREDGLVIDRFRVVDVKTDRAVPVETQSRFTAFVESVLTDREDVAEAVARARRRWRRLQKPSGVVAEVYFETTDRFTIIDVFAPDQVGLLYEIAETLAMLGLVIFSAKIGTRLDGVADCFYVKKADGARVESLEEQESIRQHILEAISRPAAEKSRRL